MTIQPRGRPALFLDRDGTIIEDTGYLHEPRSVRLIDGCAEALRVAAAGGLMLVLVSNQSGLAQGLITTAQARSVHDEVIRSLAEEGVRLDGCYYCPHGPDDRCTCRKPAAGLLLRAAADLGIDLASSYMIGDEIRDAQAGHAVGCTSILLAADGRRSEDVDHVARGWSEAASIVAHRVAPAS